MADNVALFDFKVKVVATMPEGFRAKQAYLKFTNFRGIQTASEFEKIANEFGAMVRVTLEFGGNQINVRMLQEPEGSRLMLRKIYESMIPAQIKVVFQN